MRTETDALLSLQRLVAGALPEFSEILTEVDGTPPDRPYAVVSADEWAPDEVRTHPEVTMPVTIYAYVAGESRKAARKVAEDAREALWHALRVGSGYNREGLVPLYDYGGRPAVQRIGIAGASSGTWTLALDGAETDPLERRAQPRRVQQALEELPELAGNVHVFGRLGGPWDVRFDGALRGVPIEQLVADVGGLLGPDPIASVTVLSEGSPEPWRGPRDYMRVLAPTFGGLTDPSDGRLRTATVGLRLTWGRLGHVPSGEMKLRKIHHNL